MKSVFVGLMTFLVFNSFFGWFAVYAYQSMEEFQVLGAITIFCIILLINFKIVHQKEPSSVSDIFIAYDKGFFGEKE